MLGRAALLPAGNVPGARISCAAVRIRSAALLSTQQKCVDSSPLARDASPGPDPATGVAGVVDKAGLDVTGRGRGDPDTCSLRQRRAVSCCSAASFQRKSGGTRIHGRWSFEVRSALRRESRSPNGGLVGLFVELAGPVLGDVRHRLCQAVRRWLYMVAGVL